MLLEALEAAAITLLFVQGSIFKPLRERGPAIWQELAGCPLCFGFWAGAAGYMLDAGIPQDARSLWKLAAAGALSGVIALTCKFVPGALDEAIFALDQTGRLLQADRMRGENQDKRFRAARKRMALIQKRRRMRRIARKLAQEQEKRA